MKRTCLPVWFLAPFLVLLASAHAQTSAPGAASDLGGTSWQLVKFRGSDGTTLTPKNRTPYILEFATDGSVDVRIDCNRGRGTWKSAAAGQLELGPLALTRAMCPAPLNDRFPKAWQSIRSYLIKEGHLFLAGAAGTTYEFEPLRGESAATPEAGTLSGLPATFLGTLPCADCPGIHYQVNLFANHTFVSRMSYEGRPTHLDDRGRWELREDGKILELHGGRGETQKFAVRNDTLRKLDMAGHEIASQLNYDLKRSTKFTPIASHGQQNANLSLEDTEWNLILLGGSPVHVSSQKEPHFVLDSRTKQVSGSGGCNQLAGSYSLDGDHLAFHQTVSTMMACLEGMETEKAFLEVLSEVDRWKINGPRLDLFDARGKLVASFETGNTK